MVCLVRAEAQMVEKMNINVIILIGDAILMAVLTNIMMIRKLFLVVRLRNGKKE